MIFPRMGAVLSTWPAWAFYFARMGGGHGMSDVESVEAGAPAQEPDAGGTDWKAEARKWEQRAKDANARVRELEPVAAKVSELEDASKSELQRAVERAEAAERELTQVRVVALRAEVAAAKGVPADLLSGDTREALEAAADALISFRDGSARKGNYVPSEGRSPSNSPVSDLREFTRNLFANID